MRTTFLLAFLLVFFACQDSKEPSVNPTSQPDLKSSGPSSYSIHYESLSNKATGLDYTNQINETFDRCQISWDYFYNGAGVALADFDNDGLTDIFFCGNDSPNAIFRNQGKMRFEDMSKEALQEADKWSFGATIVDINSDGYPDIYVCNSGPDKNDRKLANQLLVNNGDFTFTDKAEQYGIASTSYSVQADFLDFDKDGDLDLWVNNHSDGNSIQKLMSKGLISKNKNQTLLSQVNSFDHPDINKSKIQLFRNDGGKYIDISEQAGVNIHAHGLGLSVADFNEDGYLDVYVANDYWVPDYYFINDKEGGFINRSDMLDHMSFFGMGSDAADYNNDEILDLVVVDMSSSDHYRSKTMMASMDVDEFNLYTEKYKFPRQYMFNSFQRGVGDGYYSEIANALEVGLTGWSWAPLLFDMNNDSYNDLYVTNGYYRDTRSSDYRLRTTSLKKRAGGSFTQQVAFEELLKLKSTPLKNATYHNNGNGTFQDVTESASNNSASFSNGAAYGDFDNDGDLDIVINNLNSPATLLENKSKVGNYLKVSLSGSNESMFKNAKLTAFVGPNRIRKDYNFTRGYQSHMEPTVYFGLSDAKTVDSLKIVWPDDSYSILQNIEANQVLELNFDALQKSSKSKGNRQSMFYDYSQVMTSKAFVHDEIFFNDFNKEVLLPQKYSTLGPALDASDVNGDGMDDFYLGGSRGFPGVLFIMSQQGFQKINISAFEKDKSYEDIGAKFIDVNGDQLLDLYVASGGGGDVREASLLNDRVYINNGKGDFLRDTKALNGISSSTQEIMDIDFDNDGDMDLFVGGRNVPGEYPEKAESYLLENVNGVFRNVLSTSFRNSLPSLVTGVEKNDLNGDGYDDLIIVGEWESPKIFLNNRQKDFTINEDAKLNTLRGWWYSIKKGDFNNDGKMDFVLGNLGVNNKFHVSKEKPLNLLYDDFDGNGTQDLVLTKKYNGKDVPVRGRQCTSAQIPVVSEKFPTYASFASASVQEILGEDKVDNCGTLSSNTFESIVLMNSGNGFNILPLPYPAQWAPILDSEIIDVDRDGNLDIVIAGSIVNTEPETPSYDAGKGFVLLGKGDGTFNCETDIRKTGINMNMNVKEIEVVKRPGAYGVLVANNSGQTQLFIKS